MMNTAYQYCDPGRLCNQPILKYESASMQHSVLKQLNAIAAVLRA